jgi:hypothetical protein
VPLPEKQANFRDGICLFFCALSNYNRGKLLLQHIDNQKFCEAIRINNLANMITATRIVCAVSLMFPMPFSLPFWTLYISDMLGGLAVGIL